uniref:DNA-directed RNA polymerase subunit beta'' n=1 Tax=Platysiphonia delicata TaxID=2006979 RepID=A0A1Z1M1C7_9FLOR|nr:RNA polymerase b''''-subunit [Platysiphonia delicata]ARW59584.1 RNA polymerase b''''-subunit [Platysiphonia delicata]
MNFNSSETYFFNKVIDKSELKHLITWAFRNYGIARASSMADKLKELGFYYATKAGISLSLEDLRIPPSKKYLINNTIQSIAHTDYLYRRGEITIVERFQKIIDTWNDASENLKMQVVDYFRYTDPLNSIYIMAFSGARANISQVKQLVGMRGLMSDPQGQIIDLPIYSNFREGLTITDYFISSYGARKGLVDTALRTADSGYLTRRLVDVAQDMIIREYDCKTSRGILVQEMLDNQQVLISLKQALLGRVVAEDIINPYSGKTIAFSGQSINAELAEQCVSLGHHNILVRSPLTCLSFRSICQLCYGWNLAHSKMVDLGEAVGIIAAQSIGEPGTQLTMRTFHTGGVFTGQLSQTITSTCDGIFVYPSNINYAQARNRHGENVLLLNNDCLCVIVDNTQKNNFINLIKGSLLVVNNNSLIKKGQIIAEYPLSKRFSTEVAQKTIVADFSGSIYFYNLLNDGLDINNQSNNHLKQNLVVWLLYGKVYDISTDTKLKIKENEFLNFGTLLANIQLKSSHSGCIYLIEKESFLDYPKLLLVTSSKLYKNIKVFADSCYDFQRYIVQINNQGKFILKCRPNTKIIDGHIIADMISDVYKTKTGGIIKYLDLVINKNININQSGNINEEIYDIEGSGYILWISEETHVINKDISVLLVNHGQFVEVGTELVQNTFASNSGIIEVIEKDGIVREIVIKPGSLYPIDKEYDLNRLGKQRGFLRPGEEIFHIVTEKLIYWECMNIFDKRFILVRPVIVYSVPAKILDLSYSTDMLKVENLSLILVRRTFFKDGERVKSIGGINLVTTHLILNVQDKNSLLKCYLQLEKNSHQHVSDNRDSFLVKLITADFLSLKDTYFQDTKDIYTKTDILVKNGQYVDSNYTVAQTNIFSNIQGRVFCIENVNTYNRRILIISNSDLKLFKTNTNQTFFKNIGDFVYVGDKITEDITSDISGIVFSIQNNQVFVRIGHPYLVSQGSSMHVSNKSLIRKGENIATLVFEKSKTGDIVQGLPRIEEILEARKKTDISMNPHIFLETKFRSYLNQGVKIDDATRLSFLEVQLLLIKEIQLVYQSQGVDISDKHIEVIVRQMTSKVKIENGGNTTYLPGEIIDLQKIESINTSLRSINKIEASYQPILLGITKASLNTDSFISAASFQETTKVLSDAAISGKLDCLRGLKENVIIGRLIPAGTGFNMYNSLNSVNKLNEKNTEFITNIDLLKNHNFEDIILDDRGDLNNTTI